MNKTKLISMLIVATMTIASSIVIAEPDFEIDENESTLSKITQLFNHKKLSLIK